MNQILLTKIGNKKEKYILFFRIELISSILVILLCTFYIIYNLYFTKKSQIISNSLMSTYTISKLYAATNISIDDHHYIDYSEPFILGIIHIDKLNIVYPIISKINDDLLKISVCRFYGPMPNKVGNLCIAGHNYDNGSFFSNLNKLKINDIISISDNSGNSLDYLVYIKYETPSNDISCTSQETNGEREITLITCNNFNGNRIVLKAREK